MTQNLRSRWPDGTPRSLNNDFTSHLRRSPNEHSVMWSAAGERRAQVLAERARALGAVEMAAHATRFHRIALPGGTVRLRESTRRILNDQPIKARAKPEGKRSRK